MAVVSSPSTSPAISTPPRQAEDRARQQAPRAVLGRHLPALDGLRALAVLGVMAYHLGFGWASGGYLGVDLFFVLSGFLITSLLLEERHRAGTIRLRAFWGRRARRLLPALFLVLLGISLYAVLNGRLTSTASGGALIDLSTLRGDALATLFYMANWHAIASHQSYFAQLATPSPLQHTWSLAIEEQFYLVWPVLLVAVTRWAPRSWRKAGAGLCVAGIAASAATMALLFHAGADPTRVYFGTDTRAFDLLAGALVAFACAARPQPLRTRRRRLHGIGVASLAGLGVFWVTAGTASGSPVNFMFRGGFLLCAGLAAFIVADVRQAHSGPLGRALSVTPLRWIGTISYGLYLWHWPVFVYLSQARTGVSGLPLDGLRVLVTFLLATVSFYAIERPIRLRRVTFVRPPVLLAGATVATTLVVLAATTPSIAEPNPVSAGTSATAMVNPGTGSAVIGAGGFAGETPIRLPPGFVLSPRHRLRVVTFGDSLMTVAQYGMLLALRSTRVVNVGLAAAPGWDLGSSYDPPLPTLVREFGPQILVGTWSWDSATARADPRAYQATLDADLRQALVPGDGLFGVVLLQLPAMGPIPGYMEADRSEATAWSQRAAGVSAWNAASAAAARAFPGKVMYLPVAGSLEINGRFASFLPPRNDWSAPRSEWARVRTTDNAHFCPAGVVRYAAATLADLTSIFGLPPSTRPWWRGQTLISNLYSSPAGVTLSCPAGHA